jgi:hypothetical protein
MLLLLGTTFGAVPNGEYELAMDGGRLLLSM